MCQHGEVRIAGGPNNYTGRPEFCYFGTWRTICGTDFDQPDASVTCSLAGFNHECKRGERDTCSYNLNGYFYENLCVREKEYIINWGILLFCL